MIFDQAMAVTMNELTLEKFRPYLRMIAQSQLGTLLQKRMDVSDLVQQTMLQAHQKQDQFRGQTETQMAAWLKQILRNQLIDWARSQQADKRDFRLEISVEQNIDQSFRRLDNWLAANQTSPSLRAARNELLFRLPHALGQLDEPLREVIVMHHLQGLKLNQIAAELGCNETTVGRRLFRGMKVLHQLMNGTDA